MSVTVHTVYLCSVTVLQCKWPRALLLLLNISSSSTGRPEGPKHSSSSKCLRYDCQICNRLCQISAGCTAP